MTEPLTAQEREIYLYLIDYLAQHTYQPSVREIGAQFGIRSTKTVSLILGVLERKGYIERVPSRSRGVRLVGLTAPARMLPLPLYSRLAASPPCVRDENRTGFVTFDRRFVPNSDVFAFLADAECAAGAPAMLDGDIVLIDPSSPALDGSLVLARVGSGAVIRRIEHRAAVIALVSADPDDAELLLGAKSDFEVAGVVCGLLRSTQRGY